MKLQLATRCWLPVSILICFFATGCSNNTVDQSTIHSTGATSSKQERPKVALIMKSLANEFFSTMADGARKHNESNADRYELIVNGIKDERDLARQAALVDEMVASGVKAIVIAPADSKALVPSLRKARKAGVVVINIDNKLDADLLTTEKLDIPFVGPNNLKGAKKVGDYLASKLQPGDKVAILEGIRTSFNGTERRLGFEQAMKEKNIAIVTSQSAQWEMNQANTISSSILTEHSDLKAILAANDSMALGAISAIKAANKSDSVLVVGFDNINAAQQSIRDGRMLATADQHGDQLAVFGIELALESIASPDRKPQNKETPVDLITVEHLSAPKP